MPGKSKRTWQNMGTQAQPVGYLAYYYSDQEAELPVRGVRKKWDCKADPNLETRTYGLFTTCMPAARRRMVESGFSYIFFFTNWRGQRMLTGYYELGEFVDMGTKPRANGRLMSFTDYGIRAKRIRFVKEGIPFVGPRWSKITADGIRGNTIHGYGPRDFSKVDAALSKKLKAMLDNLPDASQAYVDEIHRLEEENFKLHGLRYPSWQRKEGFAEHHIEGYIN